MTSAGAGENLDIRVQLQGQRETAAGLREVGAAGEAAGTEVAAGSMKARIAGGAYGVLGGAAGVAGRGLKGLHERLGNLGGGLVATAKSAAGFGLAFAGWAGIKDSIETVKDFG